MSASRLTTIGNFLTGGEAHAARLFLDSHGIAATVVDEAFVGNFWQFGNAVGGIKLQVDAADAQRARALLDENDSATGQKDPQAKAWTCPQCGEQVPAGFDVCWSCQAAPGDLNATAAEQAATKALQSPAAVRPPVDIRELDCPACGAALDAASGRCPACGRTIDHNPYAAPLQSSAGAVRQPAGLLRRQRLAADALAQRAWKSAVFGVVCLPPLLNIYSVVLLVILAERHSRISPRMLRRIAIAWVLNLCVLAAVVLFFLLV